MCSERRAGRAPVELAAVCETYQGLLLRPAPSTTAISRRWRSPAGDTRRCGRRSARYRYLLVDEFGHELAQLDLLT
jgi:hypothetical protein